MRVVIDLQACQSLPHRRRGIGRYSMAFAKALLRNAGGDDVWIALNGEICDAVESIRADLSGLIDERRIVVWRAIPETAQMDAANGWRHEAAIRVRSAFLAGLRPDIVHVSSLFEGYLDDVVCPVRSSDPFLTSISLYDLIPLTQPDRYLSEPHMREWYMAKIGELKQADLVLGISRYTCSQAVELLGIPSEHTVPIMAAADPMFRPIQIPAGRAQELLKRFGIVKRFAMFTGGIDYRKNIEGLIAAYGMLPDPVRHECQLVVVCEASADQCARLQALAGQHGLQPGELILTGYVSDGELVALYNLCDVFVFPSLSEGFGLPPLEAMACGAAVIGSDTSSIPEVIGEEDALFDPRDPASVADKLATVLSNERLRERLRRHGLQRAQAYSWDNCARAGLDALREACHRRVSQAKGAISIGAAARKHKPLLAYVSPLPPERSGIADYSAELLPVLSEHYRIEAISDQREVSDDWVRQHIPLRSCAWFEQHADCYDRVLYHMGNSTSHAHMPGLLERHPGVVVLHEVFLSGLVSHLELASKVPGYWTRSLYESHGYRALLERSQSCDFEQMLERYPSCLRLIQDAEGVIVHTRNGKSIADEWFGAGTSSDWAVIPHLRAVPELVSRGSAKRQLGLAPEELVVCCFGTIGAFKQNRELLEAWFESSLSSDERCHLVLVGGAHDEAYDQELREMIDRSRAASPVQITGWVDVPTYRSYLAAADLAVQLRGSSRGEASGTVLDCLAYGIPTIVNAHGSMAELPRNAVMMLPGDFSLKDLANALEHLAIDAALREDLGRRGRAYCRNELAPERIATRYRDAIERITEHGPHRALRILADGITHIEGPSTQKDLERLAAGIAANQRPRIGMRQILVDVSELVRRDAKSGIQRVVRSILDSLLRQPPEGFRIEPVYADPGQPYRYARTFTARFLGLADSLPPNDPIDTDAGDIFLGLDLSLDEIPANKGELESMRQRGVKAFFVVYDQLPLRRADCFPPHAYGLFNSWMEAIADLSDGLLCISRSVEVHVRQHLDAMQRQRLRPLKLGHFHLGADVSSSKPTNGITPEQQALVDQLRRAPSFLMVGTIEPRKGHEQAISAFETLWAQGKSINLVLVGKAGWMTGDLVQRIRSHTETGSRLFWFDDASDELLLRLYASCSALLAPSEGEGFGLPLVEAAQHGLPILCRDLPVFREVAGQHASYFAGYQGADLAAAIVDWLSREKAGAIPATKAMPWKSWGQSVQQMLDVLLRDEWDGMWMPGENYWFAASDPDAGIGVGRRERDRVVCCGSSGVLLQTRTVTVPGGRYRLQVRGEWLAPGGEAHAEIHASQQRSILADFELGKAPVTNGLLLDAELELAGRSTDLAVWIITSGGGRVEIEGCGLRAASVAAEDTTPQSFPREPIVPISRIPTAENEKADS